MTTTGQLRAAIIALLSLASAEEQMLLATIPEAEAGSAQCWAALPLVAHNTEFKHQQAVRLRAIALGVAPAEFAEVDHSSAELYRSYATQPQHLVEQESARAAGDLIDGVRSVTAQDLTDPSRNPWLAGRQLWLQIIVRGFWHPCGHLIGYYLSHSQPDRAVALAAHGAATARYVSCPSARPWHGQLQPGLRAGRRRRPGPRGGRSRRGRQAQPRGSRQRQSRPGSCCPARQRGARVGARGWWLALGPGRG